MKRPLRSHVAAAVLLLAPAAATFVATPAVAQRAQALSVQSLNLDADRGVSPGSTLRFTVHATPGARVSVNLGGTDIVVPLREARAGTYRGRYVVRGNDRIDPGAVLHTRVQRDGQTIAHNFSYPDSFQRLAAAAPARTATPSIERFVVQPVARLEAGRELHFRIEGAPGGQAVVEIPGVVRDIPLRETRPGRYEGSYTVRQRDDLRHFDSALATLRSGQRWVSAKLDRPFVRDTTSPTISNLTPSNGTMVGATRHTVVGADLSDAGTGVDPESVRITISGRDFSKEARIDGDRLVLREELPPGRHSAEISVRDRAGNRTAATWSFDVGTSMGAGPGRGLPLMVTSPAPNALVDPDGRVLLRGRTAPHASVRVRVDAVTPGQGHRLGVADTVIDDAVQADRDGHFAVRLPAHPLRAPGSRYEVSLTASDGEQRAEERIVLHPRLG